MAHLGNYDLALIKYNAALQQLKNRIEPEFQSINHIIYNLFMTTPMLFGKKKHNALIAKYTEKKKTLSEEYDREQKRITDEYRQECRVEDAKFWDEQRELSKR